MAAQPHAARLVAGLGTAQLVAWGTLYYAIAVLGEPMRAELGLTGGHVFGAFGWSMVISGVLAPWAGRTVDRLGGRAVLVSSALVGAVGFAVLARAQSFLGLFVAWSILGLALALGLYDTCFAAIGQVVPTQYRRTVTGVTLLGGLASTVSWPATHYLVRSMGWRTGCDVYAGALLCCAPLYGLVLPAFTPAPEETRALPLVPDVSLRLRKQAYVLACAFAGSAVVGASMSAHLVNVLAALRLPSEQSVWIAASIGVMQVAGRVLELVFGSRLHPVRLGFVTFAGLSLAMLLLLCVRALPLGVYAFALVYGISNGLVTITKATLPVEMFGLAQLGALLARFSAPSIVTRALAPFLFAVAADAFSIETVLIGLVAISLLSGAAYVAATRGTRTRAATQGAA